MTTLQIADVDHSPPVNIWINETSISYDDEDSHLGTLSRQGYAPARVFVEKKMMMWYADFDTDGLTRKATLAQISRLALLLKEPRQLGSLPCAAWVLSLI